MTVLDGAFVTCGVQRLMEALGVASHAGHMTLMARPAILVVAATFDGEEVADALTVNVLAPMRQIRVPVSRFVNVLETYREDKIVVLRTDIAHTVLSVSGVGDEVLLPCTPLEDCWFCEECTTNV